MKGFLGVSLLLGEPFIHGPFLDLRQDFEEVVGELFLLADPSVVHHFFPGHIPEGIDNFLLEETLGLPEVGLIVILVNGK